MQKLSVHLKTQLFALFVGMAYAAAVLLAVGVTNSDAGTGLGPHLQPEQFITDH